MDSLTFTSNLIDSLAWPVSIAFIVWLLRSRIGETLGKITKVKHKDTEIAFSESVADAQRVATKEIEEGNDDSGQVTDSELSEYSPRGAVIEAWLRVESAIKDYARRHDQPIHQKSPLKILQELNFVGIDHGARLSKGLMQMLGKLRTGRNAAVHLSDSKIDPEDSKEYVKLAERVIQRIEES